MGVDIYTKDNGKEYEKFVLVCNTSDRPFGVVFHGNRAKADAFLAWLPKDPREYEEGELEELFNSFDKYFYDKEATQ